MEMFLKLNIDEPAKGNGVVAAAGSKGMRRGSGA